MQNEGSEAAQAEYRLWCAALALLMEDARCFWLGKMGRSASADELEEAFDALTQNTWMLRHLCDHTGHDAEWLSEGFIRWCDMA
jgi:hypothetical protein